MLHNESQANETVGPMCNRFNIKDNDPHRAPYIVKFCAYILCAWIILCERKPNQEEVYKLITCCKQEQIFVFL